MRSVERAARVLEVLLAGPPGGMRLSCIASQAELHKTTALRLLRTLVGIGLVSHCEETDCYAWDALHFLAVAAKLRVSLSIANVVQDIADRLAECTGETIKFSLPDVRGRLMVFVAVALSSQQLRIDPGANRTWPIHAGASGKAWLAYQPEEVARDMAADGLAVVTPYTIASVEVLLEELAEVRERGYALSREQGFLGAVGLAVPVRDDQGAVVAALAVAAPVVRATDENIQRWFAALRHASQALTRALYPAPAQRACGK